MSATKKHNWRIPIGYQSAAKHGCWSAAASSLAANAWPPAVQQPGHVHHHTRLGPGAAPRRSSGPKPRRPVRRWQLQQQTSFPARQLFRSCPSPFCVLQGGPADKAPTSVVFAVLSLLRPARSWLDIVRLCFEPRDVPPMPRMSWRSRATAVCQNMHWHMSRNKGDAHN